jgi:Lectin C-type domain
MKVTSLLQLVFPLQLLSLHWAGAIGAVRTERTGHEQGPAARESRGLKMKSMKGCVTARGKGKKAMKCPVPVPRRPPSRSPTRRPTTEAPSALPSAPPSALPSADVCLTYAENPAGLSSHLYGYTYAPLGATWTEARAAVQGMKSCCGGVRPHLASIGSAQENAFVLSLLAGDARASGDSAFLGLTNRNQASAATFAWDGTSEPFGYQNWCTPGNGGCLTAEPDNGPNACAVMLLLDLGVTPGVWQDYDCDLTAPRFFVFEYDCPTTW